MTVFNSNPAAGDRSNQSADIISARHSSGYIYIPYTPRTFSDKDTDIGGCRTDHCVCDRKILYDASGSEHFNKACCSGISKCKIIYSVSRAVQCACKCAYRLNGSSRAVDIIRQPEIRSRIVVHLFKILNAADKIIAIFIFLKCYLWKAWHIIIVEIKTVCNASLCAARWTASVVGR